MVMVNRKKRMVRQTGPRLLWFLWLGGHGLLFLFLFWAWSRFPVGLPGRPVVVIGISGFPDCGYLLFLLLAPLSVVLETGYEMLACLKSNVYR